MENYFEMYGIPERFSPDAAIVKNKYYELSRRYHLDRYTQASSDAMNEALRMAAMNNDAYKTLRNADATMAYILKLHSLLEDEEKYGLPPAFLMEMMDLNEAIEEYEADTANTHTLQLASQTLNEQLAEWTKATKTLTTRFDDGDHSTLLLQQIKDMYFRKKYLLRIQERIATFAAH